MTSSNPSSGTSTPRAFTSQASSAEDRLKFQTVGLVHLADFRKRRADALEQAKKDAHEGGRSGTRTPVGEDAGTLTPTTDTLPPAKKKKKKGPTRGLLSFDNDDGEENTSSAPPNSNRQSPSSPSSLPAKKLTPNPHSTHPAPKALTKASLAAEASEREKLRKAFLDLQETVRATDIAVPFVFYDGTSIPGGTVRIKKGDAIWLLLERARKVGAEKGVSSNNSSSGGASAPGREESKKLWARVGVDDLMCVRGEVIVPHHYELYYFIVNRIDDPARAGRLLFDYLGTDTSIMTTDTTTTTTPTPTAKSDHPSPLPALEGSNHDPNYTKVVDRRWYEKNKHIFPASTWREFRGGQDFEPGGGGRKDREGNAFFFK